MKVHYVELLPMILFKIVNILFIHINLYLINVIKIINK